jgi:hypothetical protein
MAQEIWREPGKFLFSWSLDSVPDKGTDKKISHQSGSGKRYGGKLEQLGERELLFEKGWTRKAF